LNKKSRSKKIYNFLKLKLRSKPKEEQREKESLELELLNKNQCLVEKIMVIMQLLI